MTPDEAEDFQWTYAIADMSDPSMRPITTFMRLNEAATELRRMQAAHPDMTLQIFVRGDVMHTYPQPGMHEQTH